MTAAAKTKRPRIRLACGECGARWTVAAGATSATCPKCGNDIDYEVLP